jgi:RNA polymerase sigma-70 factor (ECF subfamily)
MGGESMDLTRCVELYTDLIVRTAFTYVKNRADAQDITQEVFLALLLHKKEFESDEHQKAWLLRVTINKSKNHLRSHWFQKRVALNEELTDMDGDHLELLEAFMKLPEKYRTPLHLHAYAGYSIKEIAEILGKKESTIGTRLSRARERLGALLGEDHDG